VRNRMVIFCKDCGLIADLPHNVIIPYEFTCPKCGKSGKVKRRKYWSGDGPLPQIVVASSLSQAAAKLQEVTMPQL
jgi:hypothetical protein